MTNAAISDFVRVARESQRATDDHHVRDTWDRVAEALLLALEWLNFGDWKRAGFCLANARGHVALGARLDRPDLRAADYAAR